MTTKDVNVIKKDRMRYTKNSLSATLCYVAILFNVLYFANIYSSDVANDVGEFYYTANIGASVVYNLLFLLFTFLCSEGVKKYSKGYSIALIVIGAMQIVRILGIPVSAHNATIIINSAETPVMGDAQFFLVVAFLIASSICCIAAGVIGVVKTVILENYKKEIGVQ